MTCGRAKQAASEPDDRGLEWLTLSNGDRLPSRPTSLAHLKCRASEKKWPEVRAETTQQGVRPPGERQARPDPSQGGEVNNFEVLPAQVRACPHGRVPEERITDRTTTAGGATRRTIVVLTRRETTSSINVTSGKTNRMWAMAKEMTKKQAEVARGRPTGG